MGTHVSFRLRDDLYQKLDAKAKALDRSRSWLIAKAVEDSLGSVEKDLESLVQTGFISPVQKAEAMRKVPKRVVVSTPDPKPNYNQGRKNCFSCYGPLEERDGQPYCVKCRI